MNLIFKLKVLGFVLALLFGGAAQILFSFIPGKKFDTDRYEKARVASHEISPEV